MNVRVLVAEDDAGLRRVLQFKLKQKGYEVETAADGLAALESLEHGRFDLLLTDVRMPGIDGLELLGKARALHPDLDIILITAHGTVPMAVEAVKGGAFDYLTKPFDDDRLFAAIEKALRLRRLENENKSLRDKLSGKEFLKKLVGVSAPFKNLMALVEKVAATDATILLSGESGTGKELIARAIHLQSHRAGNPFVAVNCAAIPRELLESELFGHLKGAFTGAVRDKRGKFELADTGTLLLDEISELPFELQAKLLRVLQERVIEPVGAEQGREIDIRIIAATNIDLKARVEERRFRDDLYYRLNIIPIRVPALRERPDDIPVLAAQFLKRLHPKEEIVIASSLMTRLRQYHWPGNIRELENLIERMLVFRQADLLTESDLPPDFAAVKGESPSGPGEPLSFHEAEKKLVVDALQKARGNRTRAAELLKVPRHILIYRMKKYGIVYDEK